MPYYKFKKNDLFYNRIEAHPKCEFWMYSGSITYNNRPHLSGNYYNTKVSTITHDVTVGDGQTLELPDYISIEPGVTVTVEGGGATTSTPGDTYTGNRNLIKHVPNGHISLYELNIDRDMATKDTSLLFNLKEYRTGSVIHPFITKQGSLTSFKTVSTTELNTDFKYGDILTGSYPLGAGVTKERFGPNLFPSYIRALRNTLDYYTYLSPHYAYSSASFSKYRHNTETATSSIVNWNKSTQELGLLSIPSIFYGSSIQKGTLDLQFYITGTMIGRLKDEKRNGELIQVEPKSSSGSGSVAGVVLYNEGFILLTGSWDLRGSDGIFYPGTTTTSDYLADSDDRRTSQWKYFAQNISASAGTTINEASFFMAFSGTTRTPVITMLAHAKKGELNYSNNPTFLKHGQDQTPSSGSNMYIQKTDIPPANTISSSFCGHKSDYKKQTFISKVGVYDKDKNLIGIAKLATPVRKLEDDDYTFKLKLDI